MGTWVCEGRSLGARSIRRIRVRHLSVTLDASFQDLVMSVVAYMPTIVKNSKEILYLKTMPLFQIVYFVFLVFGLLKSSRRRAKNKGLHSPQDGHNTCEWPLTLVNVCRYTRILMYSYLYSDYGGI